MEVSVWFIVVFVIMWAIGPATQVLQLTLYLSQFVLLSKHDLHPVSKGQRSVYVVYMGLFIALGLFGLFYLWELATG